MRELGTAAAARAFGGQSEFAPLRRVIVRPPDRAFFEADPSRWHYAGRPDAALALTEHRDLVALLVDSGVEVIAHDAPLDGYADAIYVYDPALVTDRGAILLRMGKVLRRGEEDALGAVLASAGVSVVGRLRGDATAEAGDTLWLDEGTLAVGRGFRTNAEGIRQLAALLAPDVRILPVELPYGDGADACLHLKSLISLLDARLAVACRALLPVSFCEELARRRIEIVDVPASELATQGPNVLAVGPRDCIVLEGSPETARRLERAGCRVRAYRGREISLKAEGGPTCLTRPIRRA